MALPESPPKRTPKRTVDKDRWLHLLDPEGEEGHYARGGAAGDAEEEEAEEKKRKAGGVALGAAAAARGDKVTRGRKAGGKAKWIQGTGVDKPGHKGRLHRALHVPEGQPIPEKKLESALHSSSPHMKHMAQFAKNVKRADGGRLPEPSNDPSTLNQDIIDSGLNRTNVGSDDFKRNLDAARRTRTIVQKGGT